MKYKKEPNPDKPLTDAEWNAMGKAMNGIDELPEAARSAVLRLRGRPKLSEPKKPVNIRIDADILSSFRKTGKGWQTRLNSILRRAIEQGGVLE
jgi:uncharacterized protein (DUF4415 family)